MRAHESFSGAPNSKTLATTTSSQFQLEGGKYWFSAVGTFNSGTVTFQRVGGDGLTLLTVGTALTTNGSNVSDLPPGTYQVAITGSTTANIYWEVIRVPEE
jgi:hypothetical protein